MEPTDSTILSLAAKCTQLEAALTAIDPCALPEDGVNLPELLKKIERTLVEQAIERSKNFGARNGKPNYMIAAEFLGISRTTLVEKRRRLGMLPFVGGS